MASFIPMDGPIEHGITTPLTLTAMQKLVCGFIEFVELKSGDLMVVNESASQVNSLASTLAGREIRGAAILCEPQDIA
jgi:hypothetical protein